MECSRHQFSVSVQMEHYSNAELRALITYENGQATLNLSEKGLSKVPDAVTELSEVEVLRLSKNNLTELPPSINKLKNLKRLNLDNNNLSYLPAEIGELKELRMLDVSNNQLAVVSPTSIQKLQKLGRLHLYENKLSELPAEIGNLKELWRLWVSNNQLAVVPAASILKLKKLQELYLDNNKLSFLPAEIGNLKELKMLYVSGNPFTVDAMRSLLKLKEEKKEKIVIDIKAPAEIESQGQRAQLAYQKALNDGAVNVYRGRILLIGQDRAGKTSLKKSLIGLPFDPEEQSTKGIEVDPSTFQVDVNQVKNWQSVDENEQGLSVGCSKEVAQMVVENLQNDSDENSDDYSDDYSGENSDDYSDENSDDYSDDYSDEKSDDYFDDEEEEDDSYIHVDATSLPDCITNRANRLIRSLSSEPVENDIKQEESIYDVDLWDFAGQHLYYASHPTFFSLRAIYVLVYNLSKSLNTTAQPCVRQGIYEVFLDNSNGETNVENLLSWLATVHCITQMKGETVSSAQGKLPYLRPPIIIVGTHADKPFEDITRMKSQIQKGISRKEYERHVVRPIFSIDNTAGSQSKECGLGRNQAHQAGNIDKIQALQDKIMEVLRQEPYMGDKIPVRWINFERIVSALAAENTYYIDIKKLQTYAKDVCFIDDKEEFNTMVNFYHDLGIIIKHRSTVILKAQWLIDLFRQLITIPHFDKMDPIVSNHWNEVQESGVLSMELVNHVFSKFLLQGVVRDDILNMMEQFGLIAKFSPSTNDGKYFVPSQLKASPDCVCAVKPSSSDPCPLYVCFLSGFVPHGLFTQLVSRCIRWCSDAGPTQPPTLYRNGAWFVIGRQVFHDFILICKKQFIKVVLKRRSQSQLVLEDKSTDHEVAVHVREFVDEALQSLSRDLPYLRGLRCKFQVKCPYCYLEIKKCTNHSEVSCAHEDCLHLLDIQPVTQGNPLICKRKPCNEVLRVDGLEKWFSQRTSQELHPSASLDAAQSWSGNSGETLKVLLLANEWGSSKGGLSTINRTLAILLAKQPEVDVNLLVPEFECSEEDKRTAHSHNISVREAQRRPGFSDPLDWLNFPPRDLTIDIVIGHGAKLGKQAQVIREYRRCKWVQMVHTEPEELAMHKNYPRAIAKGEEKNRAEVDLCKLADLVVAVGPKLADSFSSFLRSSHQDIFQLTPGTFADFADVKHSAQETAKFKVLIFGRCDPEDVSLKGYDIAASAIVELNDSSYCLIFVGAPDGKQDEVAKTLLQTGISKKQLIVRSFVLNKERLKELFCEADVAIMPSRTEGFGLTALEAMSAGLPILVSGNSGFGESLRSVPEGKSFVIESEDPKVWAEAIAALRQKSRTQRLQEIQTLQRSYDDMFSWERQCQSLVNRMWKMVYEIPAKHKSPVKSCTGDDATRQTVSDTHFPQDVERAPGCDALVNNCGEEAAIGQMTHTTCCMCVIA